MGQIMQQGGPCELESVGGGVLLKVNLLRVCTVCAFLVSKQKTSTIFCPGTLGNYSQSY